MDTPHSANTHPRMLAEVPEDSVLEVFIPGLSLYEGQDMCADLFGDTVWVELEPPAAPCLPEPEEEKGEKRNKKRREPKRKPVLDSESPREVDMEKNLADSTMHCACGDALASSTEEAIRWHIEWSARHMEWESKNVKPRKFKVKKERWLGNKLCACGYRLPRNEEDMARHIRLSKRHAAWEGRDAAEEEKNQGSRNEYYRRAVQRFHAKRVNRTFTQKHTYPSRRAFACIRKRVAGRFVKTERPLAGVEPTSA